nr:mucin-17-like isoform X2 [Coffea arabica]
MGRPPSNGGPSFRFNPAEVAEMEAILQAHNNTAVPSREILLALAEKFSNSPERSGKVVVQMKQVWNWFQNRRYALRAKATKVPAKVGPSPVPRDDLAAARNVPQAPQHISVPPAIVRNVPQVSQPVSAPSVQSAGKNGSDNSQMEFEAKSARDGAWYDVATFISHRSVETSDPEVLVRFAGFGPEEDEWVNVRKHVRQRSLPCESSECVAVLPGDLILCFQEGKEQALYFDAHVLDAQRRRHDVRGCRCRFLVRYDHDQTEEIVPLRKVCRRPETDYRLQQLHAESANWNQNKAGNEPHTGNTLKVSLPAEATQKQHKAEAPAEVKEQQHNTEGRANTGPAATPISVDNLSTITAAVSRAHANITSAAVFAPVAHVTAPVVTTTAPIAQSNVPGATMPVANNTSPVSHSSVSKATVSTDNATAPVTYSNVSGASVSTTTPVANSSVSGYSSSGMSTTVPVDNSDDSRATISTAAPVATSHVSGATSSVVTTTTLGDNSNVFGANTMDSATNSNDTVDANPVTSTTSPIADSNFSGAPGVAPIGHSSVLPDTEPKGLPENVSGAGASNSVENTSTPLATIAVTRSTTDTATTGAVEGSSDENTLQG